MATIDTRTVEEIKADLTAGVPVEEVAEEIIEEKEEN
jgi:hypothetical protein